MNEIELIREKARITLNKFMIEDTPKIGGVNYQFLEQQKRKRTPKPYTYSNKNYTIMKAGILNTSRIADSLKNPTTLLLLLLQWKAYNGKKDKHSTYDKWYKEGFIVASRSVEQLAVDLDVSERTVKRWLDKLVKDRVLVIEKEGLENIYVLGLVDENNDEQYFYCGDIPVYRK